MMRGRVIEPNDTADHGRRCPSSSMSEDLVPVADELTRQIEEFRGRSTSVADQPVSLAMRDQREIPGSQKLGIRAFDLEQALTGRYDVEHHAVLERRQFQPPRRGEFGSAVEEAAHAQEVQRFAERVHRAPYVAHI